MVRREERPGCSNSAIIPGHGRAIKTTCYARIQTLDLTVASISFSTILMRDNAINGDSIVVRHD